MPDMLDLDLDGGPTSAPELPAWAIQARDALAVARTIAEIAAAIEPVKAQPESAAKATVRAAKDAAVARVRASERASLAMLLALVWARLWGWMGNVAIAAPAVTVAPTVHVVPPHVGSFKKYQGTWHGWIAHTGRAVRPGERVKLVRANGAELRVFVRELVSSSYHGGTLITFGDAPETAPATVQAQAAPAVEAAPSVTARQAIPLPVAPASDTGTLESALGAVSSEASDNASVTSAGSLAGGQLAGVGFTSAAGYVTALANGVKAATAESYKRTLRSRYHYTDEQIAMLQVTIIPEGTGPTSAGISNGIANSDAGIAAIKARTAALKAPSASEQEAKRKADQAEAERKAILIAGLVASGRGLIVSPGHALRGRNSNVSREAFLDALGTIGMRKLAPRVKTSAAQFGEVMRGLSSSGLRAWAVTRKESARNGEAWPQDVVSRWIVGTLDGSGSLGSLGEKLLIAELLRDNTVRFTGGSAELRESVTGAFTVRVAEQSYDAGDLLTWMRDTLADEYHAMEYGGFMFVPGTDEHTRAVEDLLGAVKHLLGRNVGIARALTHDTLADGIADTLASKLAEIEADLDESQAKAAAAARKDAADRGLTVEEQEIAAKAAKPSATLATNRLADLVPVSASIAGYTPMLGERAATLTARMRVLSERLTSLCDATSQRAAMLEME